MTEHTPSPWKSQLARSGSNRLQVSGPDGRQVALIWRHSPEETEANRLVVTAAPLLLEALTLARAELAGLPRSLGYDFTHLPKIDAAIAAATGAK